MSSTRPGVSNTAARLAFATGIFFGLGSIFFLVFNGALHTTPVSAALLDGLTRNTIITLARAAGVTVIERDMPREYLYLCDELFMCGTAAEVTPIREIDNRKIGEGGVGSVTKRLQARYFDVVKGGDSSHPEWLTRV